MDAVAQTARRDLQHDRLQRLVLALEVAPAVDQQEDVAPRLVRHRDRAARPPRAELRDRRDARRPEVLLTPVQHAVHLGHRAPHPLRVQPGGHAAHMGQPLDRHHAAAAEVQPVELHLLRGVGQRERRHQCAQQRRLAGLRTAQDLHVTGRAREVHPQRITPLLVRLVDDAHRHHQTPRALVTGLGEAPALHGRQTRQQTVQRRRTVQRRQPHLVRRRPLRLQPLHDHVQHRVRQGVVPARALGLGPLPRHLRVAHRHLGRREQHRPPVHRKRPAGQRRLLRPRTVDAGDVGRLEPHHLVGAELQEAGTRHVRQLVGVRNAQRRPRLRRRERPQTDPVRQVRLQTAQPSLLQTLRGQQQMHAERAADTADLHEHLDEVRLRAEQFAELVDDQHQRGDRLQRGARRAGLLVVVDVGVVARVAQHLLPAVELTADGVAHPVHQRQVVRQVGDHRGHVRHPRHAGEGRTALEVGEHEVQRLRRVRDRQPQHQGAQQLRLAGTGRAHAQPVRAHALLRGLLQVQHHRTAVLADADRHPQPLRQGTRPPGPLRVHRGGVAQVQQVGELQVRQQRFVVITARRHPQRRQLPRQRLGRRVRHGVRRPLVHRAVRRLQPQRRRVHRHRQVARGAHLLARHHLDQRDALQTLRARQHRVLRQRHPVQHQHQMRRLRQRRSRRMEPGPARQAARQHVLQHAGIPGDQPTRTRAVRSARSLGVRQPLRPLPVLQRASARGHRQDHVLRGVQRGQRPRHRPHQGANRLLLAAHRHPVERPQGHRHRQVLQRRVHRHEPLHRARGQRLQLVHRPGLRSDQRRRKLLRAQPDPHLREVLVARPSLPHPAALGDQRPQLLGGGVQVVLGVPLRVRGVHRTLPGHRQIAQVVTPQVGQLTLVAPPEPHHHRHRHGDRRGDHHHAHDLHERPVAHEEEHHRAAHAERRQQLHQHTLLMPARQLRRWLQHDLFRGHLGRQRPRRTLHDDVAHWSPIPLPGPAVVQGSPWSGYAGRGVILLSPRSTGERYGAGCSPRPDGQGRRLARTHVNDTGQHGRSAAARTPTRPPPSPDRRTRHTNPSRAPATADHHRTPPPRGSRR